MNTLYITDEYMLTFCVEGPLMLCTPSFIEYGMPVEEAIFITNFTPAHRMDSKTVEQVAPGFLADFYASGLIWNNYNWTVFIKK